MKTQHLFIAAAIACLCSACGTKIVHLQTEYQTDPMGIDVAQPRFSWQMISSRQGAAQTAYCLTVYNDEGKVYTTRKVESDLSVGIEYAGPALRPHTRYTWQVQVVDEKGHIHTSPKATFETGLMGEGWDGAQWIGSKWPHFSKYRSLFTIDFKMVGHGTFLFGYRDSLNFVQLDFDNNQIIVSHTTDGIRTIDDSIHHSINSSLEDRSSVSIRQQSLDYAKGYQLWLTVDGKALNSEPVVIRPYASEVWKPYCRLYQVGFRGEAVFSNLRISEDVWNTVLYASDAEYNGAENILFCPAEETGAPMLKRDIRISKPIRSARLYTTARGIYEYFINGERLSNDYFNPGSSDYRFRILYNTYDLTPLLQQGDNTICAQLGAGWFSDFTGFATQWQDQFGTQLSLLAKIVLTYEDGTCETIVSDREWSVNDNGPIISNSLQNGEDYDARRLRNLVAPLGGNPWKGLSADDWYTAIVYPAPEASITAYIGNAAQHNITLTAQSVTEPTPGVFVYDMGQNMVGIPQIQLHGKEGQVVTFHYGEMTYPDSLPEEPLPPLTAEFYAQHRGQVYNENYRGALSTDHYICAGDADGEVFCPHFTFHGYRYIAIEGLDEALPLENVKGLVIESINSDQEMSSFETSNPLINRLYQNILWSQRGNFVSIPTDCPQRDERMGWSGDAQVFARTATYNMNVDAFYTRWIESVRDAQGEDGNYCDYVPKIGVPPTGSTLGGGSLGWTEVGIVLPWQVYQQYGDLRFIRDHYTSMQAYMTYLDNRSVNGIQPGSGYGDWLALEQTNTPLTNTAYWGYDALLMAKMATALGYDEDARHYTELHQRIADTFNRVFVDEQGLTTTADHLVPPYTEWFASGGFIMKMKDTQTSYIVPLQAELFDSVHHAQAVERLAEDIRNHDYTLTTGFIGTPYLNLVLSRNGHDSIAYRLFEQTAYPSWLYPVCQGATTIWERWNSYTIRQGFGMVDMNSFNHYSYGAIEEWMMTYCLGIERDEAHPAYKHFFLQPRPGGSLEYAKGHYDTMYGRIESAWRKTKDGYSYECTVPANTSATLLLPDGTTQELKAGKYNFKL